MGLLPEHEGPVGGERDSTKQESDPCGSGQGSPEKIGDAGRLGSRGTGGVPLLGLRHGLADPQDEQGGKNADQKNGAWGLTF